MIHLSDSNRIEMCYMASAAKNVYIPDLSSRQIKCRGCKLKHTHLLQVSENIVEKLANIIGLHIKMLKMKLMK